MSSDPGTPGKAAGSPIPAGRKRDSVGAPAHPIIKDIGEIHSRLLDHRPVIQGEIRYFIKEFERESFTLTKGGPGLSSEDRVRRSQVTSYRGVGKEAEAKNQSGLQRAT
ncbi:Biogenesis of lysosome-related organelles complex 1 subunit 5 [Platysternon megacephalum]|uniref:Biogenesis of lysosome-related organelles complex 1 subunit 5 n=1 Tax=Platysternon megacephalum TaxID=55544 RepID=A0A4D9EEH8_9SAUR|nr:Biogenesis of lysosome-related organelles complex 1 subunit 5 [Platysternon megacephalum]